jgi:hypothetical protein
MSNNLLNIIAKLQEICSPSRENKPPNINKEAIPVWDYIVLKYADQIYTEDRLIDKQWDAAVKIFERACLNRHINPFTKYEEL